RAQGLGDMEPETKTKAKAVLQILLLAAALGGMEYYFFRTPGWGIRMPGWGIRMPGWGIRMPGWGIQPAHAASAKDSLQRPGEKHLKNIKQLTFGGENAEAYWSFDGTQLCFQSTRDGFKADQIYIMNADGSNPHLVSTGKGRCTCSYFTKDGKRLIYASTH